MRKVIGKMKRALSILLAAALIVTGMPMTSASVYAAELPNLLDEDGINSETDNGADNAGNSAGDTEEKPDTQEGGSEDIGTSGETGSEETQTPGESGSEESGTPNEGDTEGTDTPDENVPGDQEPDETDSDENEVENGEEGETDELLPGGGYRRGNADTEGNLCICG